jgi:hypothetical protein
MSRATSVGASLAITELSGLCTMLHARVETVVNSFTSFF